MHATITQALDPRSGLNVIPVSADGTANESGPTPRPSRVDAHPAHALEHQRLLVSHGNPQGVGRAANLVTASLLWMCFQTGEVPRPATLPLTKGSGASLGRAPLYTIDEANWAQKTRASKLRPITPHVSSAPSCVGPSRSSALESIRSSSAGSSKWRCAFMPVVTARHDVWGRARRVGGQAQRRGFEAW